MKRKTLGWSCVVLGLAAQMACAEVGEEASMPVAPEALGAVEQASSLAWTWGFAWVMPGQAIDPLYSFNSSGGTNSYSGTPGSYAVFMPGLDQGGGNVQVVGYGTSNVRCKVGSWGTSASGTLINVRCHDPAGTLTAAPFVVYYDKAAAGVGSTYLWYDGASVPATYSYNPSGGVNSVLRLSLGRYRVELPGSSANASLHVTAYGTGAEHCSIESFWAGVVYVRCFNTSGAVADSKFSLHHTGSAPRPGMIGGHAFISGATSAPLAYQRNQHWVSCFTTPPITVTGFQDVYYPDTLLGDLTPSMSLSTAYGTDGNYCKVGWWIPSGAGYIAHTQCFTPAGTPVNTPFLSSFMLASWPGPC